MQHLTGAALLIACAIVLVGGSPQAGAMDLYFFDGSCAGSHVKTGPDAADLTGEPGTPIACDIAVLTTALPNGHAMIQFGTRNDRVTGPLAFGGPGVSHKLNPKLATLPIERVYPPLPLAATPAETYAEHRERKPLDGQGFCFFETQDIAKAHAFNCVSKVESNGRKTVYTVEFKVSHVDVKRDFPGAAR